jgi:deoxycytidine triphosphate deaminase
MEPNINIFNMPVFGSLAVMGVPGILSDTDIRDAIAQREIEIKNEDLENCLTPVGYDVRVSDTAWIWTKRDIKQVDISNSKPLLLRPNDTALIITVEEVKMKPNIAGTIHSKVSLASLGFSHISTTIDPGWGNQGGHLLIQISNQGTIPLELKLRDPFCTVVFYRTVSPATMENTKGGKREDIIKKMIPDLVAKRKERSPRYRLRKLMEHRSTVIAVSAALGFGPLGFAVFAFASLVHGVDLTNLAGAYIIGAATLTGVFAVALLRTEKG